MSEPSLSTTNDDLRAPTPPSPKAGQLSILALVITLAAAFNFLAAMIPRSFPSILLADACYGPFLAQLGLLCVWTVLGPQRLLVRWSAALAVGGLLFGCFALGKVVGSDMFDSELRWLLRAAACLPTVLLFAQLPLWLLKAIIGGRLARNENDRVPTTELRQFALKQIMMVMVLVALALGLAQVGLEDAKIGGDPAAPWIVLAVACGGCFVLSLLATVPCVCAVFLPRKLNTGIKIVAIYTFAVIIIVGLTCCVLLGMSPGGILVVWLLATFGFIGTHVAVLGTLRRYGYRLQRVSRKPLPGDS